MSSASQFMGGGLQVGASLAMPDVGWQATLADGSIWLRTGSLVSAGSYTPAASIEHLKAHMLATRGTGVTWGTSRSVATNLAGVYVATDGDTTNLRRSTDGGATWSSVAHNSGGVAINRVIWTGALFIAVGNTATAVVVCTSTDGSSWTQRLSATVSGYTADTVTVATNGSNLHALAVRSNSSSAGVWTSANATSWTARNQGLSIGAQPLVAVDGAKIVMAVSGLQSYVQSADSGATWPASLTWPSAIFQLLAINGGFSAITNVYTVMRCTDPSAAANWSVSSLEPSQYNTYAASTLVAYNSGRTTAYIPSYSGFLSTTDGVLFKLVSVDAMAAQAVGGPAFAFGASDMVVLSTTAGGAPYRAGTSPLGTPNAVGILPAFLTAAANAGGSPFYVRIK